jgi:bifunctional non-homologous end joining protein LigD
VPSYQFVEMSERHRRRLFLSTQSRLWIRHECPSIWKYKGRSYKYIYVKDEKGLMEMIQMGVIEIHPWGATIDRVHTPDRMIFDLDPDPSVPFSEVKQAACDVRDRLKQAGLDSTLKCTGGNV